MTMMMAFALTACGSSSSTETKSNSQDVKSNVTVENTSKKETQPSYTGDTASGRTNASSCS